MLRGCFSVALAAVLLIVASAGSAERMPFRIQVVDEATGRGVPLVEFQSTDKARYYTDSNGYVAFTEPGLLGEDAWFTISSHGYEFPRESFGRRGQTLKLTPGGSAELKIRRINIAERLYRVTGQGIYRDTVLLGLKPPIQNPLLNGRVMGQDTVQTAIYRGKLHWFWGDTDRPSHFLGNFAVSGATSDLPGKGGLDPAVGINLTYFTDPKSGVAKSMAALKRPDPLPVWVEGVLVVNDEAGQERLLARYIRTRNLKPVEQGLLLYNDQAERFEELKQVAVQTKLIPAWHPLRVHVDGQEYFYFPVPYPAVRVRNDWANVTDPAAYEGFTCLKDGTAYHRNDPPLDRDTNGQLIWKWRKGTEPLSTRQLDELISSGAVKREEVPFRLQNVDDGKPIRLHTSSVYWNEYRKRWVMIGVQEGGSSFLGEVWFAEANAPEGPWVHAKKVATHAKKDDNQDFYNPLQHPYFAQEGGRLIYFEGTYVNTFSGNPRPTPYYDYNQLMYRLDLADPRLKLPEPPPGITSAKPSTLGH